MFLTTTIENATFQHHKISVHKSSDIIPIDLLKSKRIITCTNRCHSFKYFSLIALFYKVSHYCTKKLFIYMYNSLLFDDTIMLQKKKTIWHYKIQMLHFEV